MPKDAPVAFRATPPRARLLVPAHRAGAGGDDRPAYTEEVFTVVAVVPFDDGGRGGPPRQRHALRPVGLDMDRERRPPAVAGASRPATCRSTRASVRYWTPFGGFKRSGLGREPPRRPRRLHRGEERVHRHRARWLTEEPAVGRLQDRVVVVTGGGQDRPGVGPHGVGGRPRVIGDLDPATGEAAAAEVGGLFVAVDGRRRPGRGPVPCGGRRLRLGRRGLQQRRHLPARGRLAARHRPRRVAPRAGGQPHLGLPVLQARHSPHAAGRQGSIINTASFVAVMAATSGCPTRRRRAACWP